ncbi:MAG TPA: hypothetical protein VG963_06725, partial [Polyangiaceae bacterium]|nr:hypothetical protein [Polyangiaceae bacterium]
MTAAHAAPTPGPDVFVSGLPGYANGTPAALAGIWYDSFAVGTNACNRGDVPVNWINNGTDNRHPAITECMFCYSNGHFEQLGVSSVKHGFYAEQESGCEGFLGYACTPASGDALGVGCSDAYSAEMNSGVGSLGPRSQINAANGLFPYPYQPDPDSGGIWTRLSELNSRGTVNGNRYFIEARYLAGDDSGAGNQNNNASWQEVAVAFSGDPPSA